jgi:hypothetical protein
VSVKTVTGFLFRPARISARRNSERHRCDHVFEWLLEISVCFAISAYS